MNMTYTDDVNLGCLAKMVIIRCLHCKVTPTSLSILDSLDTSYQVQPILKATE